MNIKEIKYSHRNDFKAIFVCPKCGHEFEAWGYEEDLGFDMDDTDVRKMRYDTKHGWRTPRRIPSWINDAVVSTVLAWMPLPEPYKEEQE